LHSALLLITFVRRFLKDILGFAKKKYDFQAKNKNIIFLRLSDVINSDSMSPAVITNVSILLENITFI